MGRPGSGPGPGSGIGPGATANNRCSNRTVSSTRSCKQKQQRVCLERNISTAGGGTVCDTGDPIAVQAGCDAINAAKARCAPEVQLHAMPCIHMPPTTDTTKPSSCLAARRISDAKFAAAAMGSPAAAAAARLCFVFQGSTHGVLSCYFLMMPFHSCCAQPCEYHADSARTLPEVVTGGYL